MKRNPRKVRWTKAFRKSAGKEMTIDSTFEFEKRRNIAVRYDRNLVSSTVKVMKRVQEIRAKRELAYYKTRMAPNREHDKNTAIKEVQSNLVMLPKEKERIQKSLDKLSNTNQETQLTDSNAMED